jgi:outer membrane protein insertion porin family/translocation and assembly module TamA
MATALLAILPACLPAQPAPNVTRVNLEGVNSLDHDIVRRSIETKATQCRSPFLFLVCRIGNFGWAERKATLDTTEVRKDVERITTLYEIWGFPDATVTSELNRYRSGAVAVTFRVQEGRPVLVRSLEIRGEESVAGFELPARLPLRVGEPYALPRLQAMERLVYAQLARRGYPFASIEVSGKVDEPVRRADIVFEIQPGRTAVFGQTRIQAAPPIEENVVRRRLAYRTGERFSVEALERTERNLYMLPITQRVTAAPVGRSPGDSVVDIGVRVDARRKQGFGGEALLSSTDCAELRGFWQHRYLLGGPNAFAFGVRAANLFAAQADGEFPCTASGEGIYAEPEYGVEADLRSFVGRSGMLIVRGFAERESSPDVYVQEGFGAQLSLARALTRRLDAQLSYQPERNELEAADLYFCGQYAVCTATGIAELSDWNWHSPLEAIVLWTSTSAPPELRRPDPGPGRDWPAYNIPVQRWSARAGLTLAGQYTGSDYTYGRGLLEVTTTRLLGNSVELAARTRVGHVDADEVVPPRVLFFSGGPNTVRGVPQNLVGPKVLATRTLPPNCLPCTPLTVVDPDDVTVRPTGGETVLEGNLEIRRWIGAKLQLAAFVDVGRIASTAFSGNPSRAETIVTPGIGIRVVTDLGPIRVDLGYDPSGARVYPLFLQEDGTLTRLGDVTFDPYTFDQPSFLRETYRRLQLQMSIGQAF